MYIPTLVRSRRRGPADCRVEQANPVGEGTRLLPHVSMPRCADPLAALLESLTPIARRHFNRAILCTPSNSEKPRNNVYVDGRNTVSTHQDRANWTEMREYRLAIKELRERKASTPMAHLQLYDDSLEVYMRIVETHVPYEEWMEQSQENFITQAALYLRSEDLSYCAQAVWLIMVHYRDSVNRLNHLAAKEAKRQSVALDQATKRMSRDVAKNACLNVIERVRSRRREAALSRVAMALRPWVRARISERRQKADRLFAVVAFNRCVAIRKAKARAERAAREA